MNFFGGIFQRWWRPSADASGPPLGLLMGMFFTYVGIGMVWSILTVYATSLGASAATAGATISAFGASRLIVSVPAGMMSERLGRVPVMVVGLALVATASFTALAVHSMTTLLGCLILQGFGSACYGTSALSAVTDRGTPATRVRDMAAYQTATQIGLSIGPGLGGFAAALWGYGAPFACQGAMALVALLAVMRIPKNPAAKTATGPATSAGGIVALIAGVASLSYALFFGRVASSWILMPLIAHNTLGLGIGTVGALLTASSIANLTVLRFISVLVRRLGRFATMIGSTTTVLAALAVLAFAQTEAMLWVFTVLIGAGMGVSSALVSSYAADAAPAGRIGAVMGSMRMTTDLGAITGPILAGFCVDQPWLGIRGGIGLCAAVLIVTSIVFLATAKGLRTAS
ncbi:MAG TPA: MFS transporter [Stellaceae bacterium]|nr:MFS transporter [Stellaceae bacterium]